MQNTSSRTLNQHITNRQTLFCAIVGPTASGKTELAISLAERMGCEILCVDAMQVYRGLDVGSAKPAGHERGRVVHHGLDLASPLECFSASRFAHYAEPILESAYRDNRPLILCGGAGLYYRALLEGLFEVPDPDPDLRALLNERVLRENPGELHKELQSRDPASAAAIHPNDARRITRALEIIYQTGYSVTELRLNQKRKRWIGETCFIGIHRNRNDLHERIGRRTEWMYENGLIEETRMLMRLGCSPRHTAYQALGYKECFGYLQGRLSREEALEITAKTTRHYARRQITWFRRQFPTQWIDENSLTELRQIVNESLQLWRKSGNNIPLRVYLDAQNNVDRSQLSSKTKGHAPEGDA